MSTSLLERPILIGGSGSSGTTLFASILNAHSEIACGPEMSLFSKKAFYGDFTSVKRNFPKWLRWGLSAEGYAAQPRILRAKEDYKLNSELLKKMMIGAHSFQDFTVQLAAHVTQTNQKTRFAEKTPSNVYCFREFVKIFPESRLIHVIRDGRDVVCSLMNRGYSVFESSSIWLYNTMAGIQNRDLSQYLEIYYEDLVTKPQETIELVCDHVGVDFQEAMIKGRGKNSSPTKAIRSWINAPGSAISSKSVGRYKTDLSDEDYRYFLRTKLTNSAASKLKTRDYSVADLLIEIGYLGSISQLPKISLVQVYYLKIRDWTIRFLLSLYSREWPKPVYTEIK